MQFFKSLQGETQASEDAETHTVDTLTEDVSPTLEATPAEDAGTQTADTLVQDVDAKTLAAEATQPTGKSELYELMQRLIGRNLKKGELEYTSSGHAADADDGSTSIEVELKLPAGWKSGSLFHGSGATLLEAECAASAAAMRSLGKVNKRRLDFHTLLQAYLSSALASNGCEVMELDVKATTDEMGSLLCLLGHMSKKDFGRGLTARMNCKQSGRVRVRIRRDHELMLEGLNVTTSKVATGTVPGKLAGSMLGRLRTGGSVKLRMPLGEAAAKAAVALSLLEKFDNHTQQFSFTSEFADIGLNMKGIEVRVAPS